MNAKRKARWAAVLRFLECPVVETIMFIMVVAMLYFALACVHVCLN